MKVDERDACRAVRRWALVFIGVLLGGLLVRSAILFAMDVAHPMPDHLSLEAIALTDDEVQERFKARAALSAVANAVTRVAWAVFYVGGVIGLYRFAREMLAAPFTRLLAFIGATLVGMVLCAGLFVPFDAAAWGDYLMSLWMYGPPVALMGIVLLVINAVKRVRERRMGDGDAGCGAATGDARP